LRRLAERAGRPADAGIGLNVILGINQPGTPFEARLGSPMDRILGRVRRETKFLPICGIGWVDARHQEYHADEEIVLVAKVRISRGVIEQRCLPVVTTI